MRLRIKPVKIKYRQQQLKKHGADSGFRKLGFMAIFVVNRQRKASKSPTFLSCGTLPHIIEKYNRKVN
jgi:hypothetical protein